jgi:hypothetical protein
MCGGGPVPLTTGLVEAGAGIRFYGEASQVGALGMSGPGDGGWIYCSGILVVGVDI